MNSIQPGNAPEQGPEQTSKKKSQKQKPTELLELLDSAQCEFWCTPEGEAYATALVDDVPAPGELISTGQHKENWRLDSGQFEVYLSSLYYDKHRNGQTLNRAAIERVLGVLKVKAKRGKKQAVYLRCAFDRCSNKTYLDLGTDNWECIEVAAGSWQKVKEVPVKFVRSSQMGPLPEPISDKRFPVERFMGLLVNAKERDDLILIVGFLVFALSGRGPYPLLCLCGGPGSGKSTTCEAIKRLVDPTEPATKVLPHKDEEQFMVIATNSHCLAFDNISSLAVWQSDALCRLATGAGLGVRQHYKHKDEVVYQARKPIVVNGIGEVIERSDLADRAITVDLPGLDRGKTITEKEYWHRFEKVSGKILAYLLDAVACGLRAMDGVAISELPRMADFAAFVTAAEAAFGWEAGTFLRAYLKNINLNNSVALESSSLVPMIVELLANHNEAWQGTATDLLFLLNGMLQFRYSPRVPADWPSKANKLSEQLRRLAGNLERAGVVVTMERKSAGSRISLQRVGPG